MCGKMRWMVSMKNWHCAGEHKRTTTSQRQRTLFLWAVRARARAYTQNTWAEIIITYHHLNSRDCIEEILLAYLLRWIDEEIYTSTRLAWLLCTDLYLSRSAFGNKTISRKIQCHSITNEPPQDGNCLFCGFHRFFFLVFGGIPGHPKPLQSADSTVQVIAGYPVDAM